MKTKNSEKYACIIEGNVLSVKKMTGNAGIVIYPMVAMGRSSCIVKREEPRKNKLFNNSSPKRQRGVNNQSFTLPATI